MSKVMKTMGFLLVVVLLLVAYGSVSLASESAALPDYYYVWVTDEPAQGKTWQYSISGDGMVEEAADPDRSGDLDENERLLLFVGTKAGSMKISLKLVDPAKPDEQPAKEMFYEVFVQPDMTFANMRSGWTNHMPKGTGEKMIEISLGEKWDEMYVSDWRFEQTGEGGLQEAPGDDYADWQMEVFAADPANAGLTFVPSGPDTGNSAFYFQGIKPGLVTLRFGDVIGGKVTSTVIYTIQVYDDLTLEILSEDYTF